MVEYSGASIPPTNAPPGYRELHVYDLESGERVCYTDEVYGLQSIDWSPDGSEMIASVEDRDYPAIRYISTISLQSSGPERKCIVRANEWNDEGENLQQVRQLDAQHILLLRREKTRPWPWLHEVYILTSKGEGGRVHRI